MIDVDEVSRRFGPLIALHCAIVYIFHGVDIENRLDAYTNNTFSQEGRVNINSRDVTHMVTLPTIAQTVVENSTYIHIAENRMIVYYLPILTISSYPVIVTTTSPVKSDMSNNKETQFRMMDIQE